MDHPSFLSRAIETGLVGVLSVECRTRLDAPPAERQFRCEFKLIDLVTIKSQFVFNNNTKITSPLFLFQFELIPPRQHSNGHPFQPSLSSAPLELAPKASVMDCAARLCHLFEEAGNPFTVRGVKRRYRAAQHDA